MMTVEKERIRLLFAFLAFALTFILLWAFPIPGFTSGLANGNHAAPSVPRMADVDPLPPPPSVPTIGCDASQSEILAKAVPLGQGPLRLKLVNCLTPYAGVDISPDGKSWFSYDITYGLKIGRTAGDSNPKLVPGRLTFAALGSVIEHYPFVWAADSQSLFGVCQNTVNPSHWALGPQEPVSISRDGVVRPFKPLNHPAGTLDGLFWVGQNGLAVAEFGTHGDFYRPERANLHPTLAFVDAVRGKVLHSVEIPAMVGGEHNKIRDHIWAIAAHINAHGKMHALLMPINKRWIEWTQGQAPRTSPLDFDPFHKPFLLTPDGKNVLIVHNLNPSYSIIEIYDAPVKPEAPTPVKGTIVELREIATGRVVWKVTGIAIGRYNGILDPAISPDGRYAVLTMPSDDKARDTCALISLDDGHVVQRFRNPGGGITTFGPDGKTLRVSAGRAIVTYDVLPKSR